MTAASSDRALGAANARVVRLLAEAIVHRVSPGWTTWGTAADAGMAPSRRNVSEIRTVRMPPTVPVAARPHKAARRITTPCRSAVGDARARLARPEQALAQLRLLLGRRVPFGHVGQLVERVEAEELEEARRRAVEHGTELRAARFLDQAALEERGGRAVGGDAADAGHLGARDRLQVGDDRQRL